MSPAQLTKYFAYLDKLHKSGVANMWGAAVFIEMKFACDSNDASRVTALWRETLGKGKLSERVQIALEPPE